MHAWTQALEEREGEEAADMDDDIRIADKELELDFERTEATKGLTQEMATSWEKWEWLQRKWKDSHLTVMILYWQR